jgi:outer membrane protein assembly factor BamD
MKSGLALMVTAVLLAISGCGAKKNLTADEYFKTANEELESGSLQLAVENFRELLDQHPFSEYSEEAELKIGHAYYLDSSCPEAIAAFTDFQRRHPTSPFLPFVGYLIGQCYERQMKTADRDQSASQNAHAYYVTLTQQYPDSPFADAAHEQIESCRSLMAEHELQVARFYAREGKAKASEFRLMDLVNRFNDTDVAADALYMLAEHYREREEDANAALAYTAILQHHPDTARAEDAKEELAELEGSNNVPAGDAVAQLQLETGRNRALALAQVIDVPPLSDDSRGTAPVPALGPDYGPFGSTGRVGGRGY